jgi:sugar phosphate isomerase/epimerase
MFLKTTGAMPSYIYAQDASGLYVNLFVGSRANVTVKGVKLAVQQTTKYPWEGSVRINIEPSQATAFDLYVRIPAWCQGPSTPDDLYQVPARPASDAFHVSINGAPVDNLSSESGYAKLSRTWKAGDYVEVSMAMPVQRVKAHPSVNDCKGLVALVRGPVVYAVETLQDRPPVQSLFLPPDATLTARYRSDLLGGVTIMEGEFQEKSTTKAEVRPVKIKAIPYFDYGNRGPSALRVWIPESPQQNVPIRASVAPTTTKITNLANSLAIRLLNYGKFQDAAWSHLPAIGMHNIFMGVPAADQVAAVEKRLAEHGLKPLVLRGDTDLGRDSSVEELAAQLAVCEKMGVKYMFLSPKHTGVSKQVAYERLRRLGDIAKKHNVVVVLETHPDLGANAQAHLETMKAVNHPNIRVNFDTGNITFYNKGTDAVAELKKIIDYVATVELKDHNGQYETWNFPALGKGVVDFPAILKLLEKHRFRGPITLEVEGVQGVTMDETQTKQYIADSVAYIKSLGDFQ